MTTTTNIAEAASTTAMTSDRLDTKGSVAVALLRITLGVIVLVAWFDNLSKDLYTADGFAGLINWLFSEDGNNSSLGSYQSILESVVVPNAGLFAGLQLVVELAIAIGLLVGVATRFFSLAAAGFFFSLFLGYFGGNEWIWTYVLLVASAVTVFLGYGGRRFGFDEFLARRRPMPLNLPW